LRKTLATYYYDANWKKSQFAPVMRYIIAAFDRKDGNMTYVTDHYSNGKPQMTGGYSSFEPEVREVSLFLLR